MPDLGKVFSWLLVLLILPTTTLFRTVKVFIMRNLGLYLLFVFNKPSPMEKPKGEPVSEERYTLF